MALNQKVDQLKRLDTLIRLKNTGNPKQLATKLGVSESTLFALLQQAKEMGADICYNPHRNTYEYITPMRFVFGFFKDQKTDLRKFMGGRQLNANLFTSKTRLKTTIPICFE